MEECNKKRQYNKMMTSVMLSPPRLLWMMFVIWTFQETWVCGLTYLLTYSWS
jgi:hypothetical protein